MKPTRFHRLFLLLFVTTLGTVALAAPASTKTYRQGLVAIAESHWNRALRDQFVHIEATDATNKDNGTTRSSFVDVVVTTNSPGDTQVVFSGFLIDARGITRRN